MHKNIDKSVHHRFSTRIGLLLSTLGIAVGTGNIWRFPRIAAQNGSENGAGALIIAWILFLFIWSIPLIITEYLLGRKFRQGVIGTFVKSLGRRFAWMGGFVSVVATGIAFFYAVIAGWALYYAHYFLTNPLPETAAQSAAIWNNFQNGSFTSVFHMIILSLAGWAIWRGVKSIERVSIVLIPSLIIIILFALIKVLFLEGSMHGIAYLFRPDWKLLQEPEIWLHALTQNAWDTGAGWGLFITYAAYMKIQHGVVKNAFITGIGNNAISIVMAIVIFGTVFSVLQHHNGYSDEQVLEVMQTSGPASTGLTFIWLPQLFASMYPGRLIAILFFTGLTFAGFTSLISMFELSTRVFIDMGFTRGKAIPVILIFSYLAGVPSAQSVDFLSNQDYVWGIGLIISGIFIALAATGFGVRKLRKEFDYSGKDWLPGNWWNFAVKYFIPFASSLLILWWLFLSATVYAPHDWFNPFRPFSIMTCLFQWGCAIILMVLLNKWLVRKIGC